MERALTAARTAAENRGRDILILDLRDLTSEFDYFVLVTGSSGRQLRAMSEEIDHVLEDQLHDRRLGIEGYQDNRWILLDYGDIVVHLFDPDARSYYALDQLWGTAKRIEFDAADAGSNLRRLGS
ncbi:MAG TPA: ribosome silencing factor [Pirellulales bacterium]|nr:ribosome silencing factor [Pirellulales bacterium]